MFWVPVLSQESFEQSCRAIAEELGLGGGDEKDVRQLLQRYLRSKESGHWLLIIDNADDEEVIFGTERGACGVIDFLPRNDQGRVLFTTRYQRMASRVARSKIFELVEMGKGDAHDLMEKSLANKDLMRNDQGVTKLLEALTYLPLAIVQAAAYLNENKESIDEYIRLLENTEQDMVELLTTEFTDDTRYGFTNDTRFGDTHNAVASTWAVSFEQIRKDGDAASLLLFMSFVEPKDIPRLLLPSVGSEQRMTRAIGMLCGYSFLSRRKDGNSYDMHRLVHIASRAWVKTQSDAKDRKRTALKHLETIFQTDDWEDRKRWRPYMPHVMRAIETGKKENNWEHEERHLGFWMGRCLIAEGRIREAMGLLEYLVAVQETALPESHSDRLVSQQVLASACLVDGQVEKAIELLEHVVAVQETTLAESHSDRLTSQHALAGAYQADGQMQKAIGLLEQVVAIQETALAESHPDQLASQHELARAYHDDGQVKRAIGLLEYVVASRKATLAEAHPDRLASEHELARAYRTDGQIKKAIELLERVGIQESTLAESHPDRLVSQHVLASLYLIDGQAKKAIELLRHIITVQETVLVEAHPDRLALQQELARAYLADGQIKKAIALFEYLVAFHKAVLAESHPDRLALQNELAKAYQANGQVTKAIELFEHVVAVRERVLAESDPNRLAAQHHLALAYLASLQVEKAIGLLEHVVAIEKHTLAEDDKSRLISESALKQARDAYHHTPWSGGGWV